MMNKTDVLFESEGLKCSAYLYRPSTIIPPPIIVMAHGLGGTKKMRLTAFAERFVAEGYACLIFDYRYFGDSEGEPRQWVNVKKQLNDWNAAIAFARQLPDIDHSKVILWGSSFSGGHVLTLSSEKPDIAAVIAQCPFTDGFASGTTQDIISSFKLSILALRDSWNGFFGKKRIMVPMSAQPGTLALMNAPGDYESSAIVLGADPDGKNYVTANTSLQIINYYPGRKTAQIKAPVLFCVCDLDKVAPPKPTLRHAARTPNKQINRYNYGHFEIYIGEAFEAVIKDQIDFLKRTVPVYNN